MGSHRTPASAVSFPSSGARGVFIVSGVSNFLIAAEVTETAHCCEASASTRKASLQASIHRFLFASLGYQQCRLAAAVPSWSGDTCPGVGLQHASCAPPAPSCVVLGSRADKSHAPPRQTPPEVVFVLIAMGMLHPHCPVSKTWDIAPHAKPMTESEDWERALPFRSTRLRLWAGNREVGCPSLAGWKARIWR